MKINFSDFFNLNSTDLIKGLVMAAIGAALGVIYSGINDGSIDWSLVWKTAAGTAISYLLKNFFTPPPSTVVVDRSKTDVEFKK